MLYSTTNMTISLTKALATYLRSRGYDVFWHQTGTSQPHTAGAGAARAEVTLVQEFPANPVSIVRLKTETTPQDKIVVPALSLQVIGTPERVTILGLGHRDYRWERHFRVDGLAADEFQHRELQDLLHDWLQNQEGVLLDVSDYDTNPADPPELEPVEVVDATIDRKELVTEIEAVRYYVRAQATVTYTE
jgi:hypothetical protein